MCFRRGLIATSLLLGMTLPVQSQTNVRNGRDNDPASAKRTVTGPIEPINGAIAGGATAIITLQPVVPKTQPPSSYPIGSSIMGQTLTLGSVPARVWIEAHVTGWAPEEFKVVQVMVSGDDPEQDGGGFSGSAAQCEGQAVPGAGDITPAMQACSGPGSAGNAQCRATMSGLVSPCAVGEPCRCYTWNGVTPGSYFPPGNWCEPAFQDKCDPQSINSGIAGIMVVDIANINFRMGALAEVDEVAPDFAPSYFGTLVLDVPANAKGAYTIDMVEGSTFLLNQNDPPNNQIPIAALNEAVIQVVSCTNNSQCQDNNACTADLCEASGCCTNLPVSGWNPDTECCHPMTGVQAPIPPTTPCRIGGCSLGGSSGSPTFTNLTNGTACTPDDPCYLPGQCAGGECDAAQYAGPDCLKSRFISIEPGADSTPKAYRVRLVSLHHPDPPYRGGLASDFSAFEGQHRWVGPAQTYSESTTNATVVHASNLSCAPHYGDWSALGLLHVSGSEIVPSSIYEVQSIAEGMGIDVESNYSPPVVVKTGAWGDAAFLYSPPSTTIQPDAADVSAAVDKFRSTPAALSKPRAVMAGFDGSDIPNLSFDVDFGQISAIHDAFKGRPYPYAGPVPCP